jgi:hypothetical protein
MLKQSYSQRLLRTVFFCYSLMNNKKNEAIYVSFIQDHLNRYFSIYEMPPRRLNELSNLWPVYDFARPQVHKSNGDEYVPDYSEE